MVLGPPRIQPGDEPPPQLRNPVMSFPAVLSRALRLLVVALALVAAGVSVRAESALEKLELVTAAGVKTFQVEVMRTESDRARGLMFRRYMPEDRGMLFDFRIEQPVMMWMKNTYLPLDMIFISRAGKVVSIAKDAEPMSETIIPSGAPAYAVLELNAGAAARIGLKTGDQVRHAIFGR
jgi:uncharacterized membrane protein (UPF0127 family)